MTMNIELDEVLAQDVTDVALELSAGGAQGATSVSFTPCSIFLC